MERMPGNPNLAPGTTLRDIEGSPQVPICDACEKRLTEEEQDTCADDLLWLCGACRKEREERQ